VLDLERHERPGVTGRNPGGRSPTTIARVLPGPPVRARWASGFTERPRERLRTRLAVREPLRPVVELPLPRVGGTIAPRSEWGAAKPGPGHAPTWLGDQTPATEGPVTATHGDSCRLEEVVTPG
jgi:hypothetical protein